MGLVDNLLFLSGRHCGRRLFYGRAHRSVGESPLPGIGTHRLLDRLSARDRMRPASYRRSGATRTFLAYALQIRDRRASARRRLAWGRRLVENLCRRVSVQILVAHVPGLLGTDELRGLQRAGFPGESLGRWAIVALAPPKYCCSPDSDYRLRGWLLCRSLHRSAGNCNEPTALERQQLDRCALSDVGGVQR